MATLAPPTTSSASTDGCAPAGPNLAGSPALRAAGASVRLLLVALLLLPIYGFLTLDGAMAARLAVVGLLLVTLVRPEDGLLVCAGLLPLNGPLGLVLGAKASMGEPLVLAFLAAWLLRGTIGRRPPADGSTRRLLLPALLFGAVVGASMLVQVVVQQVFVDYPWPYLRQVLALLASDYAAGNRLGSIGPAAVTLEGVGLFVATITLGRRHPGLGRRVLAMATAAAAGVGALNVARLIGASARSAAPFETAMEMMRMHRITWVFPDVNAAGSYFGMMLIVAVGLALTARLLPRIAWFASALLMSAGMLLTRSRSAWLAVPWALAIVFLCLRRGPRTWAKGAFAVGVVALVASAALFAWVVVTPAADRTVMRSTQWRAKLNLVAVRAAATHPVFGVGIGRLWEASGAYMDPAVRAVFEHENAHNNFLQVLAELGIAGFVPFLWILYAVARRAGHAILATRDRLLVLAASGLVAFGLTWFVGHPLLIRQVSDAFWLVVGAVAVLAATGQGASAATDGEAAHDATRPTRLRRWLPAAAVALLALSVPIRAHDFIENEADLHLAAIGFPSKWSFDDQHVRYRAMTGRGQFYVPGNTCEVRIGLRTDSSAARSNVEVELRVDGRLANRLRAVGDSWREGKVLLRIDSGRRFRRIELRTVPADVTLRTGRPLLTECKTNPF